MTVAVAPHRDTDASRNVETRSNDGLVFLGLPLERAGIRRQRLDADVELGVGHVEAEIDVLVQRPGEVLARRRAADRHVRLKPDSVNGHTGGLDKFDDADGAVGFDGEVFEVVWESVSDMALVDAMGALNYSHYSRASRWGRQRQQT